ncbi:MAG: DUF1735 domain-containing protein [Flavisolibacter sp.]
MKKLQISFFLVMALIVGLTSCLKKDAMNFDPDQKTASTLELEYIAGGPGSAIGSGLQFFGGGAILYPPADVSDTATFNVRIAGPAMSKDVTVTIGADAKAILDNYSKDSIRYEAMPTNLYKILNPTVTIKAGQRFAPVNVVFFPKQIDPTKNYMLPISVTDAQGTNVSSNFGHIYFHTIGNPLAGAYTWDFTRYNGDTVLANRSTNFTGATMASIPSGPTTLIMGDNYLQTFVDASAGVTISFDNNNGVLSNFKASFDAATLTNLAAGGFTIAVAPKLVSYQLMGDASNHYAGSTFRTYFSLINSSGGTRSMIDKYVKQ